MMNTAIKHTLRISTLLLVCFIAISSAQDTARKVTYVDLRESTLMSHGFVEYEPFHRTNAKGLYASLASGWGGAGIFALGYAAGSWVTVFGQVAWDDDWSPKHENKYGIGLLISLPAESSHFSPYAELSTGTDFGRKKKPTGYVQTDLNEQFATTYTHTAFGLRYYMADQAFIHLAWEYTFAVIRYYDYVYRAGMQPNAYRKDFGGVSFGIAIIGV